MQTVIMVLSILVIWLSFWSLIPRDEWWFRGADFPRLQVLSVGAVVWCYQVLFSAPSTATEWLILLLLTLALAYQIKMVIPYTVLYKKQVQAVLDHELDTTQQIALLVANVLTTNRAYHRFIEKIHRYQPDVILTLETDLAWEQALSEIAVDYPYRVAVPLDNLYGMHLYSRFVLKDAEVKYLLSDEIPSIHAKVQLPSGQWVDLYCLHPQPPSPTEAKESTLRDAELLIIGRQVNQRDHSCIVMGDLNDVAWSRTTRLFQRISGLLDPRIGRHFINTFHANFPFLRWSLDHVFHSSDFALVKMQRVAHIGSDHFPVYTVLQLDKKHSDQFEDQHDAPEHTRADKQEANEKIAEGVEKAEEENAENAKNISS